MANNPSLIIRVAANLTDLKKNLVEGLDQIEVTTAGMQKLAASLTGDKLIQNAHNIVAAVNEIGGATKLTEAEKARLNATLAKTIEKYEVLGREAPKAMVDLEQATRRVAEATEPVENLATVAKRVGEALVGAFSLEAINGAIEHTMELTRHIEDLSKKSGISAEAVQELDFAAKQTGVSFDLVSNAMAKMSKGLEEGTKPMQEGLKTINLSMTQLKTLAPDQAFEAIARAIAKIEDPMKRSATAMEIFGKAGAEFLPLLTSDIGALRDKAHEAGVVLSEEVVEGGAKAGKAWEQLQTKMETLMARGMTPFIEGLTSLPEPVQMAASAVLSLGSHLEGIAVAVMAAGGPVAAFTALREALAIPWAAAIGPISALTTAVGLLGSAVAVAVVAFGSWKLGTWIGELTGATDAVQRFAGKLMGVDASVTEANIAARRASEGVQAVGDAAHKALPAMDGFDAALEKHAAHAKEAADNLQKMVEQIGGADAIGKVVVFMQALEKIGGVTKLTAAEQKALHTQLTAVLDKYTALGQTAPLAMHQLWAETEKVTESMTDWLKVSNQLETDAMRKALKYKGDLLPASGLDTAALMANVPAAMVSDTVAKEIHGGVLSGLTGAMNQLPMVIQKAFQGGGNVVKSIGASIGTDLFGGLAGKFDSVAGLFTNGLGKTLQNTFGKTVGGALGSVLPGLGTLLGSQLGDFMMKGLSKIGGWVKGLFGGPSDAEKQGREVAEAFRQQLAAGLNQTQLQESGGEEWKKTIIAIRDAYIAAGHSGEEATTLSQRLFDAEKQGGQAVQAVIDEISGVMQQSAAKATDGVGDITTAIDGMNFSVTGSDEALAALGKTQETVTNLMLAGFDRLIAKLDEFVNKLGTATNLASNLGSIPSSPAAPAPDTGPDLAVHHMGGMVWPRAHRGLNLASDEVPIIAQTGERVLNRQETKSYNAGDTAGGPLVVIQNVHTTDAGAFLRDLPDLVRRNRNGMRTALRAAMGVA